MESKSKSYDAIADEYNFLHRAKGEAVEDTFVFMKLIYLRRIALGLENLTKILKEKN